MVILEDETRDAERRETLNELSQLFCVVQEMGRRLSYETHAKSYYPVRELNELLHQVREKLDLICQDQSNN